MKCTDFEMQILDEIEGLLSTEEASQLQAHIEHCIQCQQFKNDMSLQTDLFQQLPIGIVPPISAVDAVLNRIQQDFPQHTEHATNPSVHAIAKVAHVLKSNLFVVISSSVIVTAGAITTAVMLQESHKPVPTVQIPSPSHTKQASATPIETQTNGASPSVLPSQGTLVPNESPIASKVPMGQPTASPSSSPQPIESVSPSPTNSIEPTVEPSPSPSSSIQPTPTPSPILHATTSVNVNLDELVLAWKIPNLEDTKVIYVHKNGLRDKALVIDIHEVSYHPQDPNNVYMNGSGAPIRVVQFFNAQFTELEIYHNRQWISIWVDLNQRQVLIYGSN